MNWLWAAVLSASAAWVVLRWVPRVALTPNPTYARWVLPLGALGGAGAGLVGRHVMESALLALVSGSAAVLAVVDVAEHRLPNTVIFPTLAVWALGLVLLASAAQQWPALGRTAIAAGGVFAAFLILALLARGAVGLGDVKLSALMGAVLGWFGWSPLTTGFVAGILLHGVLALGVLIVTRNPKADVPMGPALIAGAALGLASAPLSAIAGG